MKLLIWMVLTLMLSGGRHDEDDYDDDLDENDDDKGRVQKNIFGKSMVFCQTGGRGGQRGW